MNAKSSVGLIAAGLLGLGMITAGAAFSQPQVVGFMGNTPSSVASCPSIVWRLAGNTATGAVHGMAYYSDLSGVSNVTGTVDPKTGDLNLTLTKTSIGDGPVGTVTGTRSATGHIVATLKGEGCANNSVDIKPATSLSSVASGYTGSGK